MIQTTTVTVSFNGRTRSLDKTFLGRKTFKIFGKKLAFSAKKKRTFTDKVTKI